MLGLPDTWLQVARDTWVGIRGIDPVLMVLAILALAAALTGRHIRTILETMFLVAILLFTAMARWDFAATLIAVVTLIHAMQASSRRKRDKDLLALELRLAEIFALLDDFLAGLDRRSRELDESGNLIQNLASENASNPAGINVSVSEKPGA